LKSYINILINTLSTKSDSDSKKDYKRLKQIMLEEDEWEVIKDLIPVLQPFANATDYLGGSKYCTYSTMIPTLINIFNKLKPLTPNGEKNAAEISLTNSENVFDDQISIQDDDEEKPNPAATKKLKINNTIQTQGLIDKIKLTLYAAMKHYWGDLFAPKALLPSLFDPRIKQLSFVSVSQRFNAENLLSDIFDQEKALLSSSTSKYTQISLKNKKKKKSQKYNSILASFKKPVMPAIDEVADYLALKEIAIENDPLAWWYEQQENFPVLSRLAKKYLAVYACSTSSERLFSDAGNMLTSKRTRMSPRLFKMMLFLKKNGNYLESIHPLPE
jgi:hypothetical protein